MSRERMSMMRNQGHLRRKAVSLGLCLMLALSMGACGDREKESPEGAVRGAGESMSDARSEEGASGQGEEASASGAQPLTPAKVTAVRYAQEDGTQDLGNAQAYLTIQGDGRFVLEILAYDGMPKVTGVYDLEEGVYHLYAEESTAPNILVEDMQDLRFLIQGDALVYEGEGFFQTGDGARFVPYGG